MQNTILSCLQLFGLGLSFGLAGPCALGCTPFIAAYLLSKQTSKVESLRDIIIFLSARLFAYLVLGFFAGFSAGLLKQWSSASIYVWFKPGSAIIIIILGISIWLARDPSSKLCACLRHRPLNMIGLFTAGLIIGIFPCAPLLALLWEISLMSNTGLQGMFYALFFGLGTFIAGLIMISGLMGILTWVPQTLLRSAKWKKFFQAIYAILFIGLGLGFLCAN
ncbi:MAG: sulfite exporter TauE/SafE family protein [Candidatus Omnitrophota bacterium]